MTKSLTILLISPCLVKDGKITLGERWLRITAKYKNSGFLIHTHSMEGIPHPMGAGLSYISPYHWYTGARVSAKMIWCGFIPK